MIRTQVDYEDPRRYARERSVHDPEPVADEAVRFLTSNWFGPLKGDEYKSVGEPEELNDAKARWRETRPVDCEAKSALLAEHSGELTKLLSDPFVVDRPETRRMLFEEERVMFVVSLLDFKHFYKMYGKYYDDTGQPRPEFADSPDVKAGYWKQSGDFFPPVLNQFRFYLFDAKWLDTYSQIRGKIPTDLLAIGLDALNGQELCSLSLDVVYGGDVVRTSSGRIRGILSLNGLEPGEEIYVDADLSFFRGYGLYGDRLAMPPARPRTGSRDVFYEEGHGTYPAEISLVTLALPSQ